MRSEQINELASALCKAQKVMVGAKKDSANPFFKSAYADLASVWDAIRNPFSDNGLAVFQSLEAENGSTYLVTLLAHTSGQWIDSRVQVKPVKEDPQGMGSAITYMRRYALQAIAGVAPEDDDGEGAMDRGKKQDAKPKPLIVAQKTPPPSDPWDDEAAHVDPPPPEEPAAPPAPPAGNPISEPQRKRLYAIARGAGCSDADFKRELEAMGYHSSKEVTKESYDDICGYFEGLKK